MNRLSSLEYLDEMLRLPNKRDNILMRTLFCVLSCVEILALYWLLTIYYLSICLSLCLLAAKTPELTEYNWGPVSMGLPLDVFKSKLEELIANLKLVLCESLMMKIFSKLLTDLPPMQEY